MASDWVGRVLSKVEIKERIGRGNMAEVFLGTHATLNRDVAVKILHSHLTEDDWLMSRFIAEAQAVAGLRHPHIVQVYDFDLVDERPYIVMELLNGVSLKQFLQEYEQVKGRPLPPKVVAGVITAMASALTYAHSRGIVHRDVKPANVMLRQESEEIDLDTVTMLELDPILTDFGVAHMTDSTQKTASGAIIGTPSYMSPEQIQGVSVNSQSDIYSLGIMLFEMLTGHLPYENDPDASMMSVMLKHVQEPIPPLPEDLAYLQPIINKSMAKKQEERYQKATDMAAALNEALGIPSDGTLFDGKTVFAVPDTPVRPTSSGPKPAQIGIGIGALTAIVLGVLFALGFFSPDSGSQQAEAGEDAIVAPAEEPTDTPEPTATATEDPTETPLPPTATPVPLFGEIVFADDITTADFIDLPPPSDGSAYETWLVADSGQLLSLGRIAYEDDTPLPVQDERLDNVLLNFTGLIVSIEPEDDSNAAIGVPAYEATIAQETLNRYRALFENSIIQGRTFEDTLIQGIDSQVSQYEEYLVIASDAFETGQIAPTKTQAEQVINIVSGSESPDFGDYDNSGFAQNAGDDVGLEPYLLLLREALDGAAVNDPNQAPTVADIQSDIDDVLVLINEAKAAALEATETEDAEELNTLADTVVQANIEQAVNGILQRSQGLDLAIAVELIPTGTSEE